jgi:hypothetical protein
MTLYDHNAPLQLLARLIRCQQCSCGVPRLRATSAMPSGDTPALCRTSRTVPRAEALPAAPPSGSAWADPRETWAYGIDALAHRVLKCRGP